MAQEPRTLMEAATTLSRRFWALLKRSIKGTYISVEPLHLGRYVDEHAFRFNARNSTDGDRFAAALSGIIGRKLTYRELTRN